MAALSTACIAGKTNRKKPGSASAAAARLEAAKNLNDVAEAELKSARSALDRVDLRAADAISDANWRGEHLRVVDPGRFRRNRVRRTDAECFGGPGRIAWPAVFCIGGLRLV